MHFVRRSSPASRARGGRGERRAWSRRATARPRRTEPPLDPYVLTSNTPERTGPDSPMVVGRRGACAIGRATAWLNLLDPDEMDVAAVHRRAEQHGAGEASWRSDRRRTWSRRGCAMSGFEFFFSFYGLLLGFAMAELLGGFADVVRAGRVRRSG